MSSLLKLLNCKEQSYVNSKHKGKISWKSSAVLQVHLRCVLSIWAFDSGNNIALDVLVIGGYSDPVRKLELLVSISLAKSVNLLKLLTACVLNWDFCEVTCGLQFDFN